MKNRVLEVDPWKIVERGFDPATARDSESLFSIGNGAMGGRANFEEKYSGKSLQGNYIGGVYYPDKTRVGWWKNGYPEYFAKVLNSAFWIGINLKVNGSDVDLAKSHFEDFYRELDMRTGVLLRRFRVVMDDGSTEFEVTARRFVSMAEFELGAISYEVRSIKGALDVEFEAFIDADVRNEDANYDEKFWEFVSSDDSSVTMRTKKTDYQVAWAQSCRVDGAESRGMSCRSGERIAEIFNVQVADQESVTLYKYVGVASSLNHSIDQLTARAAHVANLGAERGFDLLLADHESAWNDRWQTCDIQIGGDDKAQQGIRFCIFQLLQTYTGHDDRLNIGPKGFTGEKYGGSTYWDTEAYCLPFYLSTSGEDVARQLLVYRYKQLGKAIENAEKLGFTGGAALYPMVTMTGEECHNEWEITFEEIHRNGAIAYAIYNFCRYTGKKEYLVSHGLEVLIAIARFWAQRATFSEARQQFVILGVTGPNEYENNVNNNWYTNRLAQWCLRYAAEVTEFVARDYSDDYQRIVRVSKLDADIEIRQWREVADGLYLPENSELGVFMQQDGFMDKEQRMAADLPVSERPINQHWSWDRILRSCFIKQADVLQGIYLFKESFDKETIRRNFEFYESRTVHESSLSSCVHAILAADIDGMEDRAYELYLRTSRLDLDDYNCEVHEGLHITSMAGSWLAVVEGFGGLMVGVNGLLGIAPRMPKVWKSMSFKVNYRGAVLGISIFKDSVTVRLESGPQVDVTIFGVDYSIDKQGITLIMES